MAWTTAFLGGRRFGPFAVLASWVLMAWSAAAAGTTTATPAGKAEPEKPPEAKIVLKFVRPPSDGEAKAALDQVRKALSDLELFRRVVTSGKVDVAGKVDLKSIEHTWGYFVEALRVRSTGPGAFEVTVRTTKDEVDFTSKLLNALVTELEEEQQAEAAAIASVPRVRALEYAPEASEKGCIARALDATNGLLWGVPMVVILMGTHLFFTIRLRGIQRYTGLAIKLSFKKDTQGEGDVSQFGALTTALAATIGTGNIVGVATAVALGGPGAVLWCWLTGVFGIATKYAEAVLSVKYRVKTSDGTMLGGPMYALEHGLGQKWLAVVFCIFTAVAAFGIGNMVQSNSVADLAHKSLHIAPAVTGVILTIATALVILGGIRSIARVCEGLVPFMAIFYVVGCLVILCFSYETVPATLALIVKSAFTPQAAAGGFAGASVMMAARWGVARGLFSNESGLGSAPIVAAAAQTRNPVRQALVSSTGTFWDTVVVCAMTGIVLVNTGAWTLGLRKGTSLSDEAFRTIPAVGPIVLTIGLLTFVYSTIIGWEYYGERAVEYLLGKRAIKPYRIAWVAAVMVGAVTQLGTVWAFADAANAMMALPNLVALILLSGVVVKETRDYLWSGRLDETAPAAEKRRAAP